MRKKCGMKEECVVKGMYVTKEECAMYGKGVL